MTTEEIEREAGKFSHDCELCTLSIIALCTRVDREAREEQREVDALKCEALRGGGDAPTDRLIGYDDCAAAIRENKPSGGLKQ